MNFPIIGCESAKTIKLTKEIAETMPLEAENSCSHGSIKAPKQYRSPCAANTPIKQIANINQP